jgi:hypothetical protein
MRFIHKIAGIVALVVATCPGSVRGDEPQKIKAAKEFLEKESRLKGVLFFAHPTATYTDYDYVETTGVVDKSGKTLKDYFVITYKVSWTGLFNNNETTSLDFFFDDKGKLIDLNAKSTGVFKAFGATNVVIDKIKDKIIEQVDKNGTETDRKTVRTLINDGDAKSLLVWILNNDH